MGEEKEVEARARQVSAHLFRIGPYTLRYLRSGNYWISRDGGEGLELLPEHMQAWLDRLFDEEM